MEVLNQIIATIQGLIPEEVMAQITPIIEQITSFIAGIIG